jgi:hypothetical protein
MKKTKQICNRCGSKVTGSYPSVCSCTSWNPGTTKSPNHWEWVSNEVFQMAPDVNKNRENTGVTAFLDGMKRRWKMKNTDRKTLNRIWDNISGELSLSEMESLLINRAIAAGIERETAEAFLLNGDI